jgi:hypothetical protein
MAAGIAGLFPNPARTHTRAGAHEVTADEPCNPCGGLLDRWKNKRVRDTTHLEPCGKAALTLRQPCVHPLDLPHGCPATERNQDFEVRTVPDTGSEIALFALWYRPSSGGRWHRVGRFGTRAEALNAIGGSGDWRVEEVRATPDTQRALFDDAEDAAGSAA